ncbi:hypothetical protein L3X38_026481 [Prunus dulcis]|uniref:DDE Tnp4 domain-containing protein n=1 Tax=Prunus dulcis TaxID=3755 RepID=A0AAD4YZH1_PRUDU|nr:hypothetical protein L3X38_026481 [Prunus dulcis]
MNPYFCPLTFSNVLRPQAVACTGHPPPGYLDFRAFLFKSDSQDSKLLSDALSSRNGLKVPQGKYFLVDCGFPNRRQFLALFRGVRYHLQDFAGHGNDPQSENELFNLHHASLRNVIERIFGIFKSRFTIFKSAPHFYLRHKQSLCWHVQHNITFFAKSVVLMNFQLNQ